MKKEHYKILKNKLGEEKAKEIEKKVEQDQENKKVEMTLQQQRERKFVEIAIPKTDLEDNVYYLGFRFRGHGLAQWDEKIGKFLIISYNFNKPYVEYLEHFADTFEKHFDGFVPLEKIDKNKFIGVRDKRLELCKIEDDVKRLKK